MNKSKEIIPRIQRFTIYPQTLPKIDAEGKLQTRFAKPALI